MAEREGFEPPIQLPVCRISSAVHSTTLPPLQAIESICKSVCGAAVRKPQLLPLCYPMLLVARLFTASRQGIVNARGRILLHSGKYMAV